MKKTLLLTGTSGFIGKIFLKEALHKGFKVIDILRVKNKKDKDLNLLRKNFFKSYKSIFYKDNNEIKKKLHKIKANYFINFATFYKNTHTYSEIPNFINSNIIFPSLILDLVFFKVQKIINFGTMMQHLDGKNYISNNFYASTKSAMEMITNYYSRLNKNVKIYNLKFYESFSEIDTRKKLIPTLIKNYKENKITKINSKKLELNIIHVKDIIKGIEILLKKNYESGSYCLKNSKNIKISNLINEINKNNLKKIKVKYLNLKYRSPKKNKIKILPGWKPTIDIKKKLKEIF